jgi:hypothetical protein
VARERTPGGAAAAIAVGAVALAACAGGPVEPAIDLRPWQWTWSQAPVGASLIRYGFPDAEPRAEAADAASQRLDVFVDGETLDHDAPGRRPPRVPAGGAEARFASYRYECAREDRAADEPCTVILDFWLLALEPPLAEASLAEYRERFERVYAELPVGLGPAPEDAVVRGLTRDVRGRSWYHLGLAFESGASFEHYSHPIDARRAVAVTTFVTRPPDRLAARHLARDAIDFVVVEALR